MPSNVVVSDLALDASAQYKRWGRDDHSKDAIAAIDTIDD
jgi:hypothetical protein